MLQAGREHPLCVSLVLLPGMLEREERRLEAVGKGKLRPCRHRSRKSPTVTLGKSFQHCSPPGFLLARAISMVILLLQGGLGGLKLMHGQCLSQGPKSGQYY